MRYPCAVALCAVFAVPAHAHAAAEAMAPEAAAPAPGGAAGPREIAAVRDVERLRARALASRDVAALRKLISGEYYHVESNGRVRTKTEFLQALGRDEFGMSEYDVDDMEISLVGNGRVAVVTGRYHARMRSLDTVRQVRGRYVRIWTLYPEGWRNSLHQSTEIRPAGSGEPRSAPSR